MCGGWGRDKGREGRGDRKREDRKREDRHANSLQGMRWDGGGSDPICMCVVAIAYSVSGFTAALLQTREAP